MTIEQFNTLKVGNQVYVVLNSGMAGISKYQYLGVFKCHKTLEVHHIFISPYFLSTVTILHGKEHKSRRLKDIFIDEDSAKDRHTQMAIEDRSNYI